MELAVIYTPLPTREKAVNIAEHVVTQGVVACSNIVESRSLYPWNGEIREEDEYVLLCKTTPTAARKTVEALEQLHPYDTPCILTLHVEANKKYGEWMEEQVNA